MTEYVLGFILEYSSKKDEPWVTLIKKQKPIEQKGLLNGFGGKIELHETPVMAIAREAFEEIGVVIPEEEWKIFSILEEIGKFKVVAFYHLTEDICAMSPHSKTDETVGIYPIREIIRYSKSFLVPDLPKLMEQLVQVTGGDPL
jgi:8-oxo-dGTP diphosphatase